mgnify:CR=1 FL=1
MIKIGIDAIDYYVPSLGLKIHDLAIARNIEPAKLEKGLGLKAMALMDVNEDAASMAANRAALCAKVAYPCCVRHRPAQECNT